MTSREVVLTLIAIVIGYAVGKIHGYKLMVDRDRQLMLRQGEAHRDDEARAERRRRDTLVNISRRFTNAINDAFPEFSVESVEQSPALVLSVKESKATTARCLMLVIIYPGPAVSAVSGIMVRRGYGAEWYELDNDSIKKAVGDVLRWLANKL
ncbi:MAG: hypothetical protein WAX80_01005 [Minisyncoccia bacterium]